VLAGRGYILAAKKLGRTEIPISISSGEPIMVQVAARLI
jgi:hypothetical protein